jgi:hypothetical protein
MRVIYNLNQYRSGHMAAPRASHAIRPRGMDKYRRNP